jgi:hypothetical protein
VACLAFAVAIPSRLSLHTASGRGFHAERATPKAHDIVESATFLTQFKLCFLFPLFVGEATIGAFAFEFVVMLQNLKIAAVPDGEIFSSSNVTECKEAIGVCFLVVQDFKIGTTRMVEIACRRKKYTVFAEKAFRTFILERHAVEEEFATHCEDEVQIANVVLKLRFFTACLYPSKRFESSREGPRD